MPVHHTPGPWAHDFDVALEMIRKGEPIDGCAIYSKARKGEEIAVINHNPEDGMDFDADADEHRANANLIAAAPDLLAACKSARIAMNQLGIAGDPAQFELDAAIAKAG